MPHVLGSCDGVWSLTCSPGANGFYYAGVVDGPQVPVEFNFPMTMVDDVISFCTG